MNSSTLHPLGDHHNFRDSHIPDNLREEFTARRAYELAQALWQFAQQEGMPLAEEQMTGVEENLRVVVAAIASAAAVTSRG